MIHTVLSPQVIQQIISLGQARCPAEAVGVVVQWETVIELPNRSQTPEITFLMVISDLVAELESRGIEMEMDDWEHMVIWHTHPRGRVGPSQVDMRNRQHPLTHLVVAFTPEGPVPTYY